MSRQSFTKNEKFDFLSDGVDEEEKEKQSTNRTLEFGSNSLKTHADDVKLGDSTINSLPKPIAMR